MKTQQPSDVPPTFGKSAVLLGGLLLVSLLVVLCFAYGDQAERSKLETADEVTAVGDSHYFSVPVNAIKPPPAAAILHGEVLYPVSYKRLELPDSRMIRVTTDEQSGLSVYATALKVPAQEGERERTGEKFYFLKVAPKQYIRVRAWSPGM